VTLAYLETLVLRVPVELEDPEDQEGFQEIGGCQGSLGSPASTVTRVVLDLVERWVHLASGGHQGSRVFLD